MTQATGQSLNDVGDIWRRHVRQAVTQPYLFSLLIGSLLLSIASFYTTFNGMLNFMPDVLITFCIVFAIQALLLVTSWRIGFAIADRDRPPLLTLTVFAICLVTSVFFSWVALFKTINDEEVQARTRTTRAHQLVEATTTELRTRLLAARQDQAEVFLSSPAYIEWARGVERVGQDALSARPIIDEQLQETQLAISDEIATLEERRRELLVAQASGEERVAGQRRRLERLEAQRPPLAERAETLRREFDAAREAVIRQQGLMDAEERGGAAGRGAGRGPIWRGLAAEREILAADRDTKQTLLGEARTELARLDGELEQLRAEVAGAAASATSARLEPIDLEIARLRDRIGAAGPGASVADLAVQVDLMRADLGAFAARAELISLDAAAARCGDLLEAMRANPALAERAAGLTCDRAPLANHIAQLRVLGENTEALNAQCAAGGAQARSVSALSFAEAVDYARQCVDVSGLPAGDVRDLRDQIGRLVLEEDPNASQFVKTVNAWRSGDKLSYVALVIAFFIDLLVLFSGLIGALSGSRAMSRYLGSRFNRAQSDGIVRALTIEINDPSADGETPQLANTRAILAAAQPFQAVSTKRKRYRDYTAFVDLETVGEERRNGVRQFLVELCAKNLARVASATDPAPEGSFLLRGNVLDSLRAHYEDERLAASELRGPSVLVGSSGPRPTRRLSDPIAAFSQAYGPADRARVLSALIDGATPIGGGAPFARGYGAELRLDDVDEAVRPEVAKLVKALCAHDMAAPAQGLDIDAPRSGAGAVVAGVLSGLRARRKGAADMVAPSTAASAAAMAAEAPSDAYFLRRDTLKRLHSEFFAASNETTAGAEAQTRQIAGEIPAERRLEHRTDPAEAPRPSRAPDAPSASAAFAPSPVAAFAADAASDRAARDRRASDQRRDAAAAIEEDVDEWRRKYLSNRDNNFNFQRTQADGGEGSRGDEPGRRARRDDQPDDAFSLENVAPAPARDEPRRRPATTDEGDGELVRTREYEPRSGPSRVTRPRREAS